MNIAIPIYNNSVSNVFDFASRLLLVSVEGGAEQGRREIELKGCESMRVRQLEDCKADVLLCGALSQCAAALIEHAQIEIVPYITGDVEEVLRAYLLGELERPVFEMPGCWMGRGRRCGCRERKRAGRSAGNNHRTTERNGK